MTTDGVTGVVVMAYGTPATSDEIEAYYTDVRRGRPPSPEQLADLRRRYDAIGGVSPLAARTTEQLAGIAGALEELAPGRFRCRLGTKHSTPSIEAAVDELAAGGASSLVGLVLAPHYSRASVGEYLARLEDRAATHGLPAAGVRQWHDDPVLIDLLAARVEAATDELGGGEPLLLVTAHSLPLRAVADGDPYVAQLTETADLLAAASGTTRYEIGWQSAGRTPEPWLGPDILEHLRSLPARGVGAVVVCPAGFTSDHLEILYDLDIDARRVADEAGLAFARTASLNAEPRLAAALAGRVAAVAATLQGS